MNINEPVLEGVTAVDPLAERYRAAFAKVKGGRDQWINGTLELVIVVKEAREFHRDHNDYHRWLVRNELREISKQDLSALNQFADDLVLARQLLEQTKSWSWQQVWRDRPNRPPRALSESRKGTPSRRSGSTLRKRAAVIPDVMREDYVPGSLVRAAAERGTAKPPARRGRQPRIPTVMQDAPPPRQVPKLRALTKEQVDPDFKGTHLEFITKYGHVNLHTKAELEYHKNQEALMAWLGLVSDHAKTALALTTNVAAVDAETMREWMSKPAKAQKFRQWFTDIQYTCESLRRLLEPVSDRAPKLNWQNGAPAAPAESECCG